jgi:hypothetical protein
LQALSQAREPFAMLATSAFSPCSQRTFGPDKMTINPDPKATVRYGPQTHQEMMFGFFFYFDAAEQLGLHIDPKTGTEPKKDERKSPVRH